MYTLTCPDANGILIVEVIAMPCTEARKRANAAYNRRQDNIMIRPSKAEGARIRAAAAAAGMSVQAYILDTLRARIGARIGAGEPGPADGGDSQLPDDSGAGDSSMSSR